MKNRCFYNQEIPEKIKELCTLHLQDYAYAKHLEEQSQDYQSDSKRKCKAILYSYYAHRNMSGKKWETRLFQRKLSNGFAIKVTDMEYRIATKQSKSAIEHYSKCLDDGEFTPFADSEISKRLHSLFRDYKKEQDSSSSITPTKLLRCFKTAITLQLINMHMWNKRDATARADCIVDTLLEKSDAIRYKKEVEFISFNDSELICFKK